jgi:hypothetical protein
MSCDADIDAVIPESAVSEAAIRFLDSAEWELEFDGMGMVTIPREPRPIVASRAYIKPHAHGGFGDHYEAIVYLGPEAWLTNTATHQNWTPRSGVLRLYFNLNGRFITEDRYSLSAWNQL